jgi:hypothetical protein
MIGDNTLVRSRVANLVRQYESVERAQPGTEEEILKLHGQRGKKTFLQVVPAGPVTLLFVYLLSDILRSVYERKWYASIAWEPGDKRWKVDLFVNSPKESIQASFTTLKDAVKLADFIVSMRAPEMTEEEQSQALAILNQMPECKSLIPSYLVMKDFAAYAVTREQYKSK